MMNAYPLILDTLQNRYDIDTSSVTPETTLETLGVDSLGLVELLFEVEDQLGIAAPRDFASPTTVSDLVTIVEAMMAMRPQAAAA